MSLIDKSISTKTSFVVCIIIISSFLSSIINLTVSLEDIYKQETKELLVKTPDGSNKSVKVTVNEIISTLKGGFDE